MASSLDPRWPAREDGLNFTEDRPMLALTLALTLGTDPTAAEMAKPSARVVDPRDHVTRGMTLVEAKRILPDRNPEAMKKLGILAGQTYGSEVWGYSFGDRHVIVFLKYDRVALVVRCGRR
jgi:hypothetical protein